MSQSNQTYYTVSQFIGGKHAFSSHNFKTKKQAEAFLGNYLDTQYSQVDYAIYKCRQREFISGTDLFSNDHLDNEYQEEEENYGEFLACMTVEPYGKGYLLRTDETDELFGEKYLEVYYSDDDETFETGFWNKRAKGWFFKKEYLDILLGCGAEYIGDEVDDSYEQCECANDECDEDFQEDLTGMTYAKYGKGYLLKCKKSDPRYGEKYFLEGWWMATHKGWFFKKEYLSMLKEYGAKIRRS